MHFGCARMSTTYEDAFNGSRTYTGVVEPDGSLVAINATALDFGGVTRSDVIGKKLWETPWFQVSETTQQQTRTDVRRAAAGVPVRHELHVQSSDTTATVDFSIRPLFDRHGNVARLIAEGENVDAPPRRETIESHSLALDPDTRLISYARDGTESMSHDVLCSFLALDIDVFDNDTMLEESIDTDALNGFDWASDPPHTIVTDLWGYTVVMTADEVSIYGA